jgi:hypothetical protein
MKPLGHKAYGSIPHLSQSKLGDGDHHCQPGQEAIATKKARDKHDLIIIQEKLDGSNCSVAKINGEIVALTRSGNLASESPYEQHRVFDQWVKNNKVRFINMLQDGERVVGEWLYQAHGTRYNLQHEPYVPFDIMVKHERVNYIAFLNRVLPFGFVTPRLIHLGQPRSVDWVLTQIEVSGHGAVDKVEGAVWRVERDGKVDFLVKYVRPEKENGIYLPKISGKEVVLNS